MTAVRTQRGGPGDPARRAALDTVLAVAADGAYANLALPALLRERHLGGRDAALATELAYGTLRWQGSLDEVLAAGSSRPLDGLDPPVLALLRLGAYQLLHLRIPAHAAVSTTVDLAPARARGYVNAVLRRVAEHSWPQWLDRLAPATDVDRLALACAHPAWIVRAFADALGSLAEAEQALAADNDRPAVHLVARPGRITRAELLAQTGSQGSPGPWSPYAVRLGGGDPAGLPAVRDGRAAVQDEGSQLVALAAAAAGAAVGTAGGRPPRWLDVAAGPGGKAALLAGLLAGLPPGSNAGSHAGSDAGPDAGSTAGPGAGQGGLLVANDVAPHRARLVARSLRGTTALTVCADGRAPAWRDGAFDVVLLDAPCTGLGALRRRPEARWRRQPADVPRLAALQYELAGHGLDAVRPGGALVYATCSPHQAETRGVVRRLLRSRPDVRQDDARPLLPGVPQLGRDPAVTLWPHRHGTDAMYVALLRKGT